jgi:GntR family histidine utilization transcriptional repressor
MTLPAYQRIKAWLLAEIHAGRWRAGELVPSEHELVRQFGVARMTVNRAIRELVTEGVLTRTQGAGTFVATTKFESTLVAIRSIAEEIRARGHAHRAEVLALTSLPADAAIAAAMQVEVGTPLYRSRILHHENEIPIQLEERWVQPELAPDYLAQDFDRTTPNEYLMRVAPLARVEYRIEARIPDRSIRERLAMGRDEPCLILYRRTFTGPRVASVANLYHPASRYQFSGHF